ANQLGGQDELVFDGASFAFNADRTLAFQMSEFETAITVTDWKRGADGWRCTQGPMARIPAKAAADYRACVLGFRDYVYKNGCESVVRGLSGGIDAAVGAAIAVGGLGEGRVRSVRLAYGYTSEESLKAAAGCSRALGPRYGIVPSADPVEGFL